MTEAQPLGHRIVHQERNGLRHVHEIFYPETAGACPGILMTPNFFGPSDSAREHARSIARHGYTVMMVDMFSESVRPQDRAQAVEAITPLLGDHLEMRARIGAALDCFRREAADRLTGPDHIAAAGFCFGGCVSLELARDGADLRAVISFHGRLTTPNPADARQIRAPILVLHGADDPGVSQESVAGFIREMREAGVDDWQLVQYSKTVHSFTEPSANIPGQAEYNPRSSRRAFALMYALLDEVFAA